MVGLAPAIYVFGLSGGKDVDARDKCGNDEKHIGTVGLTPR
jgi:hypothetical protein